MKCSPKSRRKTGRDNEAARDFRRLNATDADRGHGRRAFGGRFGRGWDGEGLTEPTYDTIAIVIVGG